MSKLPTSPLNIRSLPTSLKDQFKAYCAQHGYTMEDAVKALMFEASSKNWVLDTKRWSRAKRHRRTP